MTAKGYFITGTDTGCGKTEITLGMMHRLQQRGLKVAGMKPVASGAEETPWGLRNEDALRIRQQCSFNLPYALVNPFAYRASIAPHIGALRESDAIDFHRIYTVCKNLEARSDRLLVEGVGGWRVPLRRPKDVGHLAETLGLPVILVVGLRLGCINHALLTVESILSRNVEFAGWVANSIDPDMKEIPANIETLRSYIKAPLLGMVPYQKHRNIKAVATRLSVDQL